MSKAVELFGEPIFRTVILFLSDGEEAEHHEFDHEIFVQDYSYWEFEVLKSDL